jgi:hypothetical protein
LSKIIECGTNDGRASIKGFDDQNEPVEIEMTFDVITALMPNLAACEAELRGEQEGRDLVIVHLYGGATLRPSQDQGYAVLTIQCVPARPDRPPRNLGFRIALNDLETLGAGCLKHAAQASPFQGGRPN